MSGSKRPSEASRSISMPAEAPPYQIFRRNCRRPRPYASSRTVSSVNSVTHVINDTTHANLSASIDQTIDLIQNRVSHLRVSSPAPAPIPRPLSQRPRPFVGTPDELYVRTMRRRSAGGTPEEHSLSEKKSIKRKGQDWQRSSVDFAGCLPPDYLERPPSYMQAISESNAPASVNTRTILEQWQRIEMSKQPVRPEARIQDPTEYMDIPPFAVVPTATPVSASRRHSRRNHK